jgi:putative transposase
MTAIGTPLVRVTMAVRLKALEAENAKLKRIVAEQMLDMSAMKELLQKHW